MSSNVEFNDYSIRVKNLIKETAITFLIEAGELLHSEVVRNTAVDKGQTAGSWGDPVLDEGNLAVHVGSNFQNAIWEEFGTGEHAEMGNGRKGYWVFVLGSDGSSTTKSKTYSTKEEAKKAMAILRKKGLPAFYTNGKEARHPFLKAYVGNKARIIKRAEELFKKGLS